MFISFSLDIMKLLIEFEQPSRASNHKMVKVHHPSEFSEENILRCQWQKLYVLLIMYPQTWLKNLLVKNYKTLCSPNINSTLI